MSALQIQQVAVVAEGTPVVHDVSFAIARGEVSVMMGPNGSGKSTLVNALMGHPRYQVTQGALLLNGEDILSLTPDDKARKGLFLSLQHTPNVGGSTLAAFLHKVHVARTDEQVDVLAYYLTLRERAQELGIPEELLDRPLTAGLSGGEKKLSEVLQLAVCNPAFAILDEVDSGVDVDALRKVFGAITALAKQGTGFLIISHHPSLLSYVQPAQVHVMAGGRLVRSGGKALAEEVHTHGFCKAIACPMVEGCDAKKA